MIENPKILGSDRNNPNSNSEVPSSEIPGRNPLTFCDVVSGSLGPYKQKDKSAGLVGAAFSWLPAEAAVLNCDIKRSTPRGGISEYSPADEKKTGDGNKRIEFVKLIADALKPTDEQLLAERLPNVKFNDQETKELKQKIHDKEKKLEADDPDYRKNLAGQFKSQIQNVSESIAALNKDDSPANRDKFTAALSKLQQDILTDVQKKNSDPKEQQVMAGVNLDLAAQILNGQLKAAGVHIRPVSLVVGVQSGKESPKGFGQGESRTSFGLKFENDRDPDKSFVWPMQRSLDIQNKYSYGPESDPKQTQYLQTAINERRNYYKIHPEEKVPDIADNQPSLTDFRQKVGDAAKLWAKANDEKEKPEERKKATDEFCKRLSELFKEVVSNTPDSGDYFVTKRDVALNLEQLGQKINDELKDRNPPCNKTFGGIRVDVDSKGVTNLGLEIIDPDHPRDKPVVWWFGGTGQPNDKRDPQDRLISLKEKHKRDEEAGSAAVGLSFKFAEPWNR